MNLPWFRMYSEFSGDPVIQSLAFEDQRHYIILLCLKCNGVLDRDIADLQRERIILRGLGLDPIIAGEVKRRLLEVNLIDENWQPIGWEKRQFKSDLSTKRVHKYRNNKETGNVSETLQVSVSESFRNGPEQIQNRTDKEKNTTSVSGLKPEVWKAFKTHRLAIKKKLTPYAEDRLLKKLAKLCESGEDPNEIVSRSIESGWSGFWPLKEEKKASSMFEGAI